MASLVDRCNRCAKCFVLSVLALGYVSIASAQSAMTGWAAMTDWGRIERFTTESNDAMYVQHSAPFKNTVDTSISGRPPPCKVVDAGYVTDPNDAGHKLHHAAIIGAYLHNKEVRFGLSGCTRNAPHIVSVDVKD